MHGVSNINVSVHGYVIIVKNGVINMEEWYEHYSEAIGLICRHCKKNEACSDGEVKECKIAEAVRKFFIEGEKNEKEVLFT